MLILGILAAIALPAFFNQKDKAGDAKAKETAHSAQVAMETCATDNNNSYANCDVEALEAIEPTLPPALAAEAEGVEGLTIVEAADEYTITVTSTTDNTFAVDRDDEGTIVYPCTVGGSGGCPDNNAGPEGVDTWN